MLLLVVASCDEGITGITVPIHYVQYQYCIPLRGKNVWKAFTRFGPIEKIIVHQFIKAATKTGPISE